MDMVPKISVANEITLVTLQKCPLDINFIADIFKKISSLGVDVDMISLAPAHGSYTSVSFTISDDDFDKVYSYTSELDKQMHLGTKVSSRNCKISVYSDKMKNCPGVAAKVFKTAADVCADIRLITTSEVDISILVTDADFEKALKSLEDYFKTKAK